jgi:hypothetical protein
MCDYSLMNVPNRLAVEGEELVIHLFATRSIGLADPDEINRDPRPLAVRTFWSKLKDFFSPPVPRAITAVCIPPGARLMLRDMPDRLQHILRVRAAEMVTFTQLTADEYHYRDAIRFANGHEVLLQELRVGQRVRVLCLGETAVPPDPAAQPFFAKVLR